MAAIDLFVPPDNAPGFKMGEFLSRSVLVSNGVKVLGEDLNGAQTSPLFNIPPDTFIVDIIVHIEETFDDSETMVVGDTDTDRFMDNTAVAPGTVGYKSMRQDAQPGSGGHLYATADTIDLTTTANPTQGIATFWVFYIPNFSAKIPKLTFDPSA